MEKTTSIKQEPRYSLTEFTETLRQVIAEKNLRMGMTELFFADKVTLELVSDTFKKLNSKQQW